MAVGLSMSPNAVERRRAIYEMRKANNEWATIASVIGLKEPTCKAYFKAAIDIDGQAPLPAVLSRGHIADEEAVVEVMSLATNPFDERFDELRASCKKAGMKPSLVAAIIRRMRSDLAAPHAEMKRLSLREMTDQLESKIALVLGAMDEYSVANASLKDQSIALGILVDRHQLLSGKPTQIIDMTARMQLQQLLPAMVAEAARRGMAIDVPMVERVK